MPSYTDNLGLVKWNPDDFWDASDYNENMEKLDDNAGNNDSNMAYVAVKSGNNWQLPSGKNAAIGEFIVLNGVLGHATAAITGGSTNIVSGTNWTPETKGGLNALNTAIGTLTSRVNPYMTVIRSVVITSSVGAGNDVIITEQDIINGLTTTVPTGYTLLAIVPEGVRPNTAWTADPRLIYFNTNTRWQIHNMGSSADSFTATFICFYKKSDIV